MPRYWASITLLSLSCICLVAQPWRTYKSRPILGSSSSIENLPANTVAIPAPNNLIAGRDGKIYFNSIQSGTFAIDESGLLRSVVGSTSGLPFAVAANGTIYSITGGGLQLQFTDGRSQSVSPQLSGTRFTGVAIDSLGRVFAADQGNRRIFRLNDDGTFTIVAGLGAPGQLPAAPIRIATDSSNRMLITLASGQIVRLNPLSNPVVIAGEMSSLGNLSSVAGGADNLVYFSHPRQQNISRIATDGSIQAVVVNSNPADIAVDREGRLLIAESNPPQIWRLEANGSRTRIAGLDPSFPPPAVGESTTLNNPQALALDQAGNLFIGDTNQNRILRRSSDGTISTLATGVEQPARIALGENGSIYAAHFNGRSVVRIGADGMVARFAGTGDGGDEGDGGLATQARFRMVRSVESTRWGIAISDQGNNRIRVVETSGVIQNLAGNGNLGPVVEGSVAKLGAIGSPTSMAMDKQGSLVFFDATGFRLRRISPEGIITNLPNTVAGDAQAADRCRLDGSISGMAFDSTNSIVYAARGVLCRIEPDGTQWLLSDELNGVSGIAIDSEDRLYVSDTQRNQVYLLEPLNFSQPYSVIPKISGITGAAGSRAPGVNTGSPGALMTVFGSGFTRAGVARAVSSIDLINDLLPTKLADTCVIYDGKKIPLTFVSATQINFQLPNPPIVSDSLRVRSNCDGAEEFTSIGVRIEFRSSTPEFLYWTNSGSTRNPIVAVEASTNAFIGAVNLIPGLNFRPARPGDVLTLYCISLGLTNPVLEAGTPARGPAPARGTVQVLINNAPLTSSELLYSGASPGTAGLYQINLRVPNLPDGDHPIRILIDTTSSPTDGYLTVRR